VQQQTNLRATLFVREQTSRTEVTYPVQTLASVSAGSADWTAAEATFTLDPALHTQPDLLYDQLRVELTTNATYAGALGLDAVSVQEVGAGAELALNGSFTEGHKSVSGGDHAAN
jgi:hypothetical protein